jgi:hypothetical protein
MSSSPQQLNPQNGVAYIAASATKYDLYTAEDTYGSYVTSITIKAIANNGEAIMGIYLKISGTYELINEIWIPAGAGGSTSPYYSMTVYFNSLLIGPGNTLSVECTFAAAFNVSASIQAVNGYSS